MSFCDVSLPGRACSAGRYWGSGLDAMFTGRLKRGAPQIHRINVLRFFRKHESLVELALVTQSPHLRLLESWFTLIHPYKTRTFSAPKNSGEMDCERPELPLSTPSRPIFGTRQKTCILSFCKLPLCREHSFIFGGCSSWICWGS